MRNPLGAALFLFFLLSGATLEAAPAVDLTTQLRSALQQQQSRLGELQPWQQVLFDQEVLLNHQRFIKDYRPSSNGVSIEADLVNLRHYLEFHASQNQLMTTSASASAPAEQRAYAFIRPQNNCQKCTDAEPAIRTQLKDRLERRGFKVIWVPVEQAKAEGKALDDKIVEFSIQNTGAAAVIARWELRAPQDAAHADDLNFNMHVTLAINDLHRGDADLEVLENGSFEAAFARLMTDGFTEVGLKQSEQGLKQQGGNQILIEITGFTDFAGYRVALKKLQEKLGESEPLVEKKVSRGAITLALKTIRKKEEVQALLSELPSSGPIKWEVR
ncbi:MAG: hypothetical protein A2X94_14000 [Bdellovibrionales bacterium GWB1_55_8]|nr:MAG: hypothetical protein A2X94_14000 [Bdellovibrionales bacterium GWB1_55_8]